MSETTFALTSVDPHPMRSVKIYRNGDQTDMLVSIALDGTITYGPNYTPDEAAKIFWNAISIHAPGAKQ